MAAALSGNSDPMADPRERLYVVVCAAATVLFAALAAAVFLLGSVDRLDVRFVNWVHEEEPDWLVESMRIVTHLGSAAVLGPLTLAAAILFLQRQRPAAALFVLAAFAGSQLLDQGLKFVFRRARPTFEDPYVQLTTYAFPSGHAFGATATYGALALLLASGTRSRKYRRLILGCACLAIMLIAASRVALGVHYLLDVIAGLVAGIGLLSGLLLALQRARRPDLRLVLFHRPLAREQQPERAGIHS
jgi:membrane-associated phospholipid phosphatase